MHISDWSSDVCSSDLAADAAATYLPGFVPQISLLIAVALLLLSVAVLVYFLHHIQASIRINSVLAGIGRRLLRVIEERFLKANGARSPSKGAGGKPVAATASGYVHVIDFEQLAALRPEEGSGEKR